MGVNGVDIFDVNIWPNLVSTEDCHIPVS